MKRYLTSGARYRRLEELVKHWRGQIDPKKALEILRDKRGAGDAELGLGNRNALDAIIATHSVVVDATALTIWVVDGAAPASASYVGFDLRKELCGEERPAAAPICPRIRSRSRDEFRALPAGASAALERRRAAAQERSPSARRRGGAPAEGLEEKMPEPHRLIGDLAARARRSRRRAHASISASSSCRRRTSRTSKR